MIMCDWFSGDSVYMQRIQYANSIWSESYIYAWARQTYIDAMSITGEETQMWKLIKSVKELDGRFLEYMHDAIAAIYRFIYIDEINNYYLANVLTSLSDNEYYLSEWKDFLMSNFGKIRKNNPEISRHILNLVAYPCDIRIRRDSESWIHGMLIDNLSHLVESTQKRLKPSDKLNRFLNTLDAFS